MSFHFRDDWIDGEHVIMGMQGNVEIRRAITPARVDNRSFVQKRIMGIETLIQRRHGGPCDTDDGEIYFEVALPYLAERARFRNEPVDSARWAQRWVPRFREEKHESWFREIEVDVEPIYEDADEIAERLWVTEAERRRFRPMTFGAIDRRKPQRKEERRAADAAYQKRKRAANGAKTRTENLSAAKPWVEEGIARSTWYKRLRREREEASRATCVSST